MLPAKPTILCLSGNDPSGGAGIQADIETLSRHHVHCLPLITLNTIQDSKGIKGIHKTPDDFLLQQAELLNKDIHIDAIKIGMLADIDQIQCVRKIIESVSINSNKDVPVILDPVLSSGLGSEVKQKDFVESLCKQLLPLTFICTPNFPEASKIFSALSGKESDENPENFVREILETGLQHLVITGTHANLESPQVQHWLFQLSSDNNLQMHEFSNARLQYSYHGSGCTLSSAIAANLVQDKSVQESVGNALDFTFMSIQNGYALGKHQLFPNRS